MRRLSLLVVALLVGAAAPARAWCEASCLETAHQAESPRPHCPSHESTPEGSSLSSAPFADCPTIESARPVVAKLNLALAPVVGVPGTLAPQHLGTEALRHLTPLTHPRHLRNIPLRL